MSALLRDVIWLGPRPEAIYRGICYHRESATSTPDVVVRCLGSYARLGGSGPPPLTLDCPLCKKPIDLVPE